MLTVIAHELPSTQGSKKSFTDKSGHVRTIEDNRSALMVWRGAVVEAVVKARDAYLDVSTGENPYRNPLVGPVVVGLTLTMPRPVSTPKRKPVWPLKKRDVDKLERAVFDALTLGGAFGDDGQVVAVVPQEKWFTQRDAPEVYVGPDAAYMLTLPLTARDVMDHPGAVIRVAHLTEFPPICGYLAERGFTPEDVAGAAART